MTIDGLNSWDRNRNCWISNEGIPVTSAPVQTETLTEAKASFLKDKAQIETLTTINGLSIKEIERRARPGEYAGTGFIGKDESFKEVLKKDWDTVEKLKVTHIELAAHLKNIIAIAKRNKSLIELIEYHTKDMESNTIFSEAPQKLIVTLAMTKGYQYDIFMPEDEDDPKEVKTPNEWGEEYSITNKSNGVKLKINSGVLSYIHEFGFYEGGGETNPYRVDPAKVMALLTGK